MTTSAAIDLFDEHTREFLAGNPSTAVARAAGGGARRADAERWLAGLSVPDRKQRARMARSKMLRRGHDFEPTWGKLWGVELWTGLEPTDHQVARWLDVFGDWEGAESLAESLNVDERTVQQWFHGEKSSSRAAEIDALVAAMLQQAVGARLNPIAPIADVGGPARPATRQVEKHGVRTAFDSRERVALLEFASTIRAAADKLATSLEAAVGNDRMGGD